MEKLISVKNISKSYRVKNSVIEAVKGVSFDIYQGETLALIGESGSGKSTIGEIMLGLIKPDKGNILYEDKDIGLLKDREMRKLRKDIQIVFQQSFGALDPKMTVEELLLEPLKTFNIVPAEKMQEEVNRLLNMVELSNDDGLKFPHQMSGGQKQRVSIARAAALRPKFMVCDEPVSALDVSVQGQILNLLSDLKKELNLTYLFISHDLKVVKHICDRIAVMYKGEIVEIGDRDKILNSPQNAYTKLLVESIL